MNSNSDITLCDGLKTYTVRYYSADVEASWSFDDEDVAEPSLQIVYERPGRTKEEEENFWLYLSKDDALAVGRLLVSWAKVNGAR